jgi:DNA-binding beta-propeller fold protein YncE
MSVRVNCTLSPAAEAVLATLGRTEDVTFSPNGRRLALAGFLANRIAIFNVAIAVSDREKHVAVTGVIELEAPTLKSPHGLCFLDDETIAVANRDGGVHIFALPPAGVGSERRVIEPLRTITGDAATPIRRPGSVASFPLDRDRLELLVCHNYSNLVTRHVLDRRRNLASIRDDLLLRRDLDVPDGICVSRDGRWIAVSNHNTHEVLVYRRDAALGPESAPDAVLRNVICPHGVRFTGDGRHVLVADAHAPYVNVYASGASGWEGVHDPVRTARVLSPATYFQGRANPQEGGPKGLDLDPGMNVLACTTEFQTLAFFDVGDVLTRRTRAGNRLRRYLQWRLAKAIYHRKPGLYGKLRPMWP